MAKPLSSILGRQLRTTAGKVESRQKLIGAVRAAAARMRLNDDDRRAIQLEATGKGSMGDMNLAEIGLVLDRLNRDRPAPMAHRAHVGKIRALWWTCYWIGAIEEPNDAALDAFVTRQTGIASLRFLDHRRAPALIEALKAIAARGGVLWPVKPGDAIADRWAVITALWRKLVELRQAEAGASEIYLAAALKLQEVPPGAWGAQALDQGIRTLGKKLRRALSKRSVD